MLLDAERKFPISEVQPCSYLLEQSSRQNIRGEKCSRLRVVPSVCYTHFGVLGVSYEIWGL